MKLMIVFLIFMIIMFNLKAQTLKEEEVFPLMQNKTPSYVCCEECDEYVTKDAMTLVVRAIKDTFFQTIPSLRDTKFKGRPVSNISFFLKEDPYSSKRWRRFKKFEMEKRTLSYPKHTSLDTFYLRKDSNHIDIVSAFWMVTPSDTLIFSGQLQENSRLYPIEQLFHTFPSIPHTNHWFNGFLGFFTHSTNLTVSYNSYIEDSVYTISVESPEGPYDISTIYLSYKYGFLGFVTQYPHPFRHRLITCETWYPPFHSPSFRKEDGRSIKE